MFIGTDDKSTDQESFFIANSPAASILGIVRA